MAVVFNEFVLDKEGNPLKMADGKILCHVTYENGQRDTVPIDENDLRTCGISLERTVYEVDENQNIETGGWTDESTRLLLDMYGEYLPQVGPLKKFKVKKQMWECISQEIYKKLGIKKTWMQCENRYKTILKRKKNAVTKNKTSGEERNPIEFEEELKKIASIDDSVQPEVLRSATMVQNETEKKGIKRKTSKISDTLVKIHKQKEESRERRHKEKCDLIKSLIQVLSPKENE